MLRTALAVALAALAGAVALAPAVGARTACKSTSAGGRQIKVFIIRGVSCRRADKVAAAYMEFRFPLPYAFRCALTHGNSRYAFTCGHGRRGSDLRDWRQAFRVRDLGRAG